jgi:hypothetical protein
MKYGEFDPASVSRPLGGSAHFEFLDRDNATFSYTPSEFSTTTWGHTTAIDALPLVRVFAVPVSEATGMNKQLPEGLDRARD